MNIARNRLEKFCIAFLRKNLQPGESLDMRLVHTYWRKGLSPPPLWVLAVEAVGVCSRRSTVQYYTDIKGQMSSLTLVTLGVMLEKRNVVDQVPMMRRPEIGV